MSALPDRPRLEPVAVKALHSRTLYGWVSQDGSVLLGYPCSGDGDQHPAFSDGYVCLRGCYGGPVIAEIPWENFERDSYVIEISERRGRPSVFAGRLLAG